MGLSSYRQCSGHLVRGVVNSLSITENQMKSLFLPAAALTIALASLQACPIISDQHSASATELKTLVKNYAFRNQPGLKTDTQFAIEEYPIDGLKALGVQAILARYLAPDGSQFNEALLIYHDGKFTPLAPTLGGHGLMSAVVSGGKLYCTYSFGSGRHRCHLAQLTIVGGKLAFARSEPLFDQDCFVKQDGDRLRLEQGDFEKFNAWKAEKKMGEIVDKKTGFVVLNDAGKEVPQFSGRAVEKTPR